MAADDGRKRKWDDAGSSAPKAPLVVPTGASAPSAPRAVAAHGGPTTADAILEKLRAEALAAQAAAAAALAAQPPGAVMAALPRPEPAREVVINDAPAKARVQLAKRSAQEDIQRRTCTVVSLKGRYYPPGAAHGEERPLYISIRPAANAGRSDAERQAACDAAAAEVEAILAGKPPGAAAAAARNPHQAVVYVGFQAPPSFDLLAKIRGP
ncbi:Protein RIK, partial [Monoraphidium neglectum]